MLDPKEIAKLITDDLDSNYSNNDQLLLEILEKAGIRNVTLEEFKQVLNEGTITDWILARGLPFALAIALSVLSGCSKDKDTNDPVLQAKINAATHAVNTALDYAENAEQRSPEEWARDIGNKRRSDENIVNKYLNDAKAKKAQASKIATDLPTSTKAKGIGQ